MKLLRRVLFRLTDGCACCTACWSKSDRHPLWRLCLRDSWIWLRRFLIAGNYGVPFHLLSRRQRKKRLARFSR